MGCSALPGSVTACEASSQGANLQVKLKERKRFQCPHHPNGTTRTVGPASLGPDRPITGQIYPSGVIM
ncbi:hypothetical protein GDO81_028302 [Engystomops pustulosus]|uniref:Uncharacterized protein n=1 Tax=Engystomops pustulosus TaxID=76066 RepID=A0AAV6YES8_ENGPU|nr:hypothetical protein GDO81_028302 [Engystomops pustulosus]